MGSQETFGALFGSDLVAGSEAGARVLTREASARREAAEMAEDYGIDRASALAVFDLLGPDELHDGYVCALQDMEAMGDFDSCNDDDDDTSCENISNSMRLQLV